MGWGPEGQAGGVRRKKMENERKKKKEGEKGKRKEDGVFLSE
jgi:hypothetical protein